MIGFIKIHRSLIGWEWFDDSQVFHVFLTILLNANHVEGTWRGLEVKRGQWVTGRKKLSAITNIPEQTIRTILKKLERSEITIKTTNKFSVITVVNWDTYQITQDKTTNKTPTDKQQLTTNKNVKKETKIYDDEDLRLAEWIYGLILNVAPSARKPSFNSWANTIRLMREQDNLTRHHIAEIFKWANADSFWSTNILSPSKLRDKFPTLEAKAKQGGANDLTPQQKQIAKTGACY